MTMCAEKGISISTVIVMDKKRRLDIFFFQPVKKNRGRIAKKIQFALASMASVAKCLLVRALSLPATLLK